MPSRSHGKTETRTYVSWSSMKTRCLNPNNPSYKFYGARGITICKRWRENFVAFLTDMGERPPNASLDRIDVNGNYEPGNCRWADTKTQRRNARHAKLDAEKVRSIVALLKSGVRHAAIAKQFGVGRKMIEQIKYGGAWADVAGV